MTNSNETGIRTNRPYELCEYDPAWVEQFEVAKTELEPLFGNNLVTVEHIGSTSVPGMVAKPQVDVLVIVYDLDQVAEMYEKFRELGYEPRGREYIGTGDEYVTKDSTDGRRLLSIHIYEDGHPQIAEYRELREYLTHNEAGRNKYNRLKKVLYEENPDNYVAYDRGKDVTLQEIITEAKTWAKEL